MAEYDGDVKLKVNLEPEGVKQTAKKLRSDIQSAFDVTAGKDLNATLQRILINLDKLSTASQQVTDRMSQLENTKVPTEEFIETRKQIDAIQAKLGSLNERMEKFKETGGKTNTATFKRMQYDAAQLEMKLEDAQQDMKSLVESGKAFKLGSDTEEYAKLSAQAEGLNNKMRIAMQQTIDNTQFQQMLSQEVHSTAEAEEENTEAKRRGNKEIRTQISLTGTLKHSFEGLKGAVHRVTTLARKLTSYLSKSQHNQLFDEKSLKRGLRLILKYVIGVRSLFVLYRKLRAAGKQALQALAKESEEVNASMSNILTVFTQLKNSIATVIQPILNVLAPILTHIGEVANVATQKMANFLAVLTGQSYYYRAKKIQKDYAESLGKTAENAEKAEQALASIDKLDVISKNDSASNSVENVENLFEKVDVDSSANDLIERIKKMWKEADFSSVGESMGTKLKDALENIPWNTIQDKANKTTKSISTMINGFVEVDGLGTSIGSNFAKLLNTMQQALNTFLTETHWDSIGSFIADNIMGFATTFDGELLGKNIAGKFNAVSDLIKGFNSKMDWTKAGEFTSNIINGFFDTIKPKELGKNISDLAIGIIDGINAFLTKTNWSKIGEDVGDFITSIDWDMITGGLANVFVNVIRAALKLLPALLKKLASQPEFILDLGAILTIKLAVDTVKKAITTAIASALGGSLTTSSALTLNLPIPYIAITAGIVYFATKAIQRGLPGQDVVEDTKGNEAQEDKYEAKQKQLANEEKKYNTYLNDKLQKYGRYLTALSKGTSLEQEILDINKEMEKIRNSSDSDELKARKLAIYEQELLTIYEYMIHDLEELDKQGKLNTSNYILRYDEATKHVVANLSNTNKHITEVRNNLGGTYTSANNASGSLQYMTDIAKETAYAMAGIKDKKITITADTTQADKNIKTTKTNLNNVKDKNVTVDVKPQKQNIIQKTWNDACTLIKKAINSGLIEPLNNLTITMNDLGGGITSMLGNVGKKSNSNTTSQKMFTIPTLRLAQGAVIPANREFLAILGDQKQGTNVEAPLSTIEQAVENVLARRGSVSGQEIVLNLDGKTVAKVVWDETEKRYKQTGVRFA